MTSYHGGKQRIGAAIAKIISEVAYTYKGDYKSYKGYVEPFCGMLGVYQHSLQHLEILPSFKKFKFKAGDINESVIQMWNAVKQGWIPPTSCSRKKFYQLKGDGESSPEKGFIGHACAFRGVYFLTFKEEANLKHSSNKLVQLSSSIQEIDFNTGEYTQFSKLKGWIIYCDPPYFENSKFIDEFNHHRTFDYKKFYTWAEKMAKHNLVFISERANLPYTLVGVFPGNEKLYLVTLSD